MCGGPVRFDQRSYLAPLRGDSISVQPRAIVLLALVTVSGEVYDEPGIGVISFTLTLY